MKTRIIPITNVKGTSKEPASDEASRMKRTAFHKMQTS